MLNLVRNIKLKELFHPNISEKPLFSLNNSSFYPNEEDTVHSNNIGNEIIKLDIDVKDNYTKNNVLNTIRYKFRKNNLMLVKADKGNILIIIDKNKYNDLIMKHLDDSQHYIKVSSNCNSQIINKIKSFRN